ncbi:hypothetical protein SS50377_21973 [Spironucleus salmonicida]|uniref:Uncharacterized protein n=1 Tax=Spironucleus salmonicida TaxID=348837 RepID=V6LTJ0_9EUKA|nr:hypothetical protein SS50377_21973 [Spironucleus salmonicida]|eukprot:EST47011.1 hypothetical protein SS50377_12967 [Spironucleus salmonicida]
MKEQVQILVQTKSTQERVNAIIEMYLTNEPREPLEIKITSWDNMLLLFNSRITQGQVSEMCAKLLMANIKADKLPELLQKLISTKSQTSRSFYLVAEDAATFYLQITDTCDDQQFPRFSLPVLRCDFEKVSKHLQDWLKYYRNLEVEMQGSYDQLNQETYQKETIYSTQLAELNDNFNKLLTENKQLTTKLISQQQSFDAKSAELQSKILILDRDSSEFSSQNKDLQASNIDLTARSNKLQNELQLAQIKITELTTASSMNSNQIQAKLSELAQVKQELGEAMQGNIKLNQLNEKLQMQINSQEELFQQRINNSSGEVSNLFNDNVQLKTKSEELQILSQKLAENLQVLEAQKDEYFSQKTYLEAQLERAINALNDVLMKNEHLTLNLTNEQIQNKDLITKFDQMNNQYMDYNTQLVQQTELIKNLEAKLSVCQKQLIEQKQRADDAEQTHGREFYKGILENPEDAFLKKNRQLLISVNSNKPTNPKTNTELSLDDISVCSEYKQYLRDSSAQNASVDLLQQASLKTFDMSKYLNKMQKLPKVVNQRASDSNQSGKEECGSSLSLDTKNLVSKYMKGKMTNIDVEVSSTSEDLIFRAMDCVGGGGTGQLQKKEVTETQFDLSCKGDVQTDDLLAKFVGMLDEEFE